MCQKPYRPNCFYTFHKNWWLIRAKITFAQKRPHRGPENWLYDGYNSTCIIILLPLNFSPHFLLLPCSIYLSLTLSLILSLPHSFIYFLNLMYAIPYLWIHSQMAHNIMNMKNQLEIRFCTNTTHAPRRIHYIGCTDIIRNAKIHGWEQKNGIPHDIDDE